MCDSLGDYIETFIKKAVTAYDQSFNCPDTFEELISFGELVDRLSIINFKLYKLKDEVMDRQDDDTFKAWAAVEDVKLVRERSRLKKCIDEKIIAMITRVYKGDISCGFNPEVKKYGQLP